jgi:hypothetical protein
MRLLKTAPALAVACAAALVLPSLAAAAEPALDRLVPGDAALVVALEDLPGLRQRFATSPFGRAWADEDVRRFLAPLYSNPGYLELVEQVKTETGHSPEELLGFATGDLLFTVPASSLVVGGGSPDGAAFLALEVGENEAKLREIVARQEARRKEEPGYAETTEGYNGVTLHLAKPDAEDADAKGLVWALHEGRWFLASRRELVTGALDALAAGGLAEPLASAPGYRALLDRAEGRPDYLLHLDFQAVYPAFVAGFESATAAMAQNPYGIEPSAILRAFGLDALVAASASGRIAADGSTSGEFALSATEDRGIIRLLAYRDGPVARPDWVPASWINVSSQNFAFVDLYSELEGMLARISPLLAGMLTGQIQAFDRQLNIDLQRDFVGNLGPRVVSGIALPATDSGTPSYDEAEQFFAISLADAAAFERTLEAIKARFLPPDGGPLEKREYLGRTLHVFTPPPGGPAETQGFAYAVSDGWLLYCVGSAAPLEAVLQGMHRPEPSASFWARPEVRAALDTAPASAFSLQFAELPRLFASLCSLAVKAQAADEEGDSLVDPAAAPGPEVFARYFSHAFTYGERRENGFYFKTSSPAAPTAP